MAANTINAAGEAEIRNAVPAARAAAVAVKSRSESTGWQTGEFTGLPIAIYQNWLYEQNRAWRFTDATLCVLWCVEFPQARSDYAKHYTYIASTRRDYNNGRHQAPAPAEACVGYDRWGEPVTTVRARGPLPTREPVPMPRSEPAAPRAIARPSMRVSDAHTGNGIDTDPEASSARLAALEANMAEHVLGPNGMMCSSYSACTQSHGGRFFEGQLHHVGKHFDARIDGTPMRVVVVGQEYGNGPAQVTLADRYQDVAVQTGLHKRFRTEFGTPGRNPHMRGTTSMLRLLFGLGLGDRHDEEFVPASSGPVHLFDMFALVNFLLCSAIASDEHEIGSKHGRSTPTMQANCARHFVRTIEILQPTLVVVQGKGTLQWMAASLHDTRIVSDTLRWVRIGQHDTLLATLSHPSAQGPYNWADLSRPYLQDVVVPTAREARRLMLVAEGLYS